jgi:hypothetical protein
MMMMKTTWEPFPSMLAEYFYYCHDVLASFDSSVHGASIQELVSAWLDLLMSHYDEEDDESHRDYFDYDVASSVAPSFVAARVAYAVGVISSHGQYPVRPS